MAQATLPGLLSVLRPVVVPTRSCRLHRLTRTVSARRLGWIRPAATFRAGAPQRTLSSWYVPGLLRRL